MPRYHDCQEYRISFAALTVLLDKLSQFGCGNLSLLINSTTGVNFRPLKRFWEFLNFEHDCIFLL